MHATSAPQVLPPSWLHVLEQIETSLEETVRQSEQHAQAVSAVADGQRDAAWSEALARLDDRLAALTDGVDRAGRAVAVADAALAEAANGIDGWLAAARAVLVKSGGPG